MRAEEHLAPGRAEAPLFKPYQLAGDNYLGRRVASRRTVTRPVVVVLGTVTRHGPWSWTLPAERRPREGHRAAMATKLRTLRVDRVPWENA